MRKIRRGLWYNGRTARMEVARGKSRRRRQVPCATRAQAEHLYKVFRKEVLEPTPTAPAATVREYVEKNWPISGDARRPISAATARAEWFIIEARILPALGTLRFDQVTDMAVEDFAAALLKAKLMPASVNGYLRIVAKILRHAARRSGYNIPALADCPSSLRTQELHLEMSPDEIRAFLGAFDTGVVRSGVGGESASAYFTGLFRASKPLFICAVHLGLLRGDLLSLRWTSVDFERGLVTIHRRKTNVVAVIPMSAAVREALLECRARSVVSAEFVFVTQDGWPYSVSTVRRYFAAAKKIAGIKRRLRFHDLRHSFASLCYSSGVSLGQIKVALGHSNIRTSERYSRVSTAALAPIAEALNRI